MDERARATARAAPTIHAPATHASRMVGAILAVALAGGSDYPYTDNLV